jgi:hypothetical protein
VGYGGGNERRESMIPTAAALYFVMLVIALLIFIAISKNRKRASIISVVAIGAYVIYAILTCGPNPIDVSVMRSMGDKIDEYLTTKGKPASLDSIPNLPYKLKCSSSYNCSFRDGEKLYKIWIDDNYYAFSLEIYTPKSKTGIVYMYDGNNSKYELKNYKENPLIYSSKRTGICNPMRQ